MELALSLGNRRVEGTGICMGVGMKKKGPSPPSKSSASASDQDHDDDHNMNMMIKINQQDHQEMRREKVGSSDPSPSLRLHLHPHSPVPLRTQPPPLRFPWLSDNRNFLLSLSSCFNFYFFTVYLFDLGDKRKVKISLQQYMSSQLTVRDFISLVISKFKGQNPQNLLRG